MTQTATARRTKGRPKQQPTPWAHGRFHWNELRTRNAERAKRFYRDAIGWSFERSSTPDGHDYWIATVDGQPVAGMLPLTSPRFDGVPESWMSFLAVDDVDARVGAGIGWITPV